MMTAVFLKSLMSSKGTPQNFHIHILVLLDSKFCHLQCSVPTLRHHFGLTWLEAVQSTRTPISVSPVGLYWLSRSPRRVDLFQKNPQSTHSKVLNLISYRTRQLSGVSVCYIMADSTKALGDTSETRTCTAFYSGLINSEKKIFSKDDLKYAC